jgi:hypothetical protein
MPTTNRERRSALARVRTHLTQAFRALPEAKGSVGHWRPLLKSMIASIDDEIGTEPEEPVDDADAELPDADPGEPMAFIELDLGDGSSHVWEC